MTTRIWYENNALNVSGIGPYPARSLSASVSGNRVVVQASSGMMITQLAFGEYADKAGATFASPAAVKAYLDAEFAKYDATPGPKGDTGATGARGQAGPAGATGATGAQGPAGFGTVAPSTSTRALDTTFQPSATKAVLVSYSIKTQVTNPLLIGTSTCTVRLLSDASNPPTTERGRAEATSGVGVTVTLALTTSNTAVLSYLVPAGHYVRLVSAVTGTGTASIVAQTEEVLG